MNTMQEEFDIVVRHLYTQGRPASFTDLKGKTGCFYRKGDLTCAVGCRIPKYVYDPGMDEVGGVESLIREFGAVLPPEIVQYRDMFDFLQQSHDAAEVMEDGTFDLKSLRARLSFVADTFKLNTSVLESLYEC